MIMPIVATRSDESKQRFYRMSAQIMNERKKYHNIGYHRFGRLRIIYKIGSQYKCYKKKITNKFSISILFGLLNYTL